MFDERKSQAGSGFGDPENKPGPVNDPLSEADSFMPPPPKPVDKESSATGFAAILARGGVEESPSLSGLSANADPGGKVGSSSIIEAISDKPRSKYADIPEARVIEFRREREQKTREPVPTPDSPPPSAPSDTPAPVRSSALRRNRRRSYLPAVILMLILGITLLLIGLWALGVLKGAAVPLGPSSDPDAIKSARTFAYLMLIALPVGVALLGLGIFMIFNAVDRKK
ncbi:MAG TPA: hypothetical protein VKJ65_06640 [Phycisphaerae bacterium]|nr:hypothetical protein [Phycisphaerae bacterium]